MLRNPFLEQNSRAGCIPRTGTPNHWLIESRRLSKLASSGDNRRTAKNTLHA
jgi:hypothetical protein